MNNRPHPMSAGSLVTDAAQAALDRLQRTFRLGPARALPAAADITGEWMRVVGDLWARMAPALDGLERLAEAPVT